ncbi:MAG: alkaline phosphatase family protein, partial [Balneolaceae bacterium]|nr:alkaline phosphatase family protein [Balneolaceae bacterium]
KRGINAATHAYDNLEPVMLTLFAAMGPEFKSGERVSEFESVHIYELMAHLLNLNPAPNDGNFDEVRMLLR